jgi:hypothetical protein
MVQVFAHSGSCIENIAIFAMRTITSQPMDTPFSPSEISGLLIETESYLITFDDDGNPVSVEKLSAPSVFELITDAETNRV